MSLKVTPSGTFSISGRFITLEFEENFYRSAKLWRSTRNIFKSCVLNSYVIYGIHKVVIRNELFTIHKGVY